MSIRFRFFEYFLLLNACKLLFDAFLANYRLGGEVSKVFPDLLLATMDIIHTQYKNLKGRDGYSFNTDEAKERVCCYTFNSYFFMV